MKPESPQPAVLAEPSSSPSLFKFDAVFFDFDGVLILSEPTWWSVIEEVLHEHGRVIKARVNGLKLRNAIDLQLRNDRKLAKRVEKEVRKRAEQRIKEQSLTDDEEIRKLIYQIHGKGIKLGVVSSSDRKLVDDVLTRHRINEMFSVVIGGDNVKNGKPSPEGYKKAARRIKVDRSRCCAVEDSGPGIEAAAEAGMHVVQFVVKNGRANSLAVSFSDVSRTILGDAEPKPNIQAVYQHPPHLGGPANEDKDRSEVMLPLGSQKH
jgi:HAD superfamily hydrolase (TIGR01509 family)